MWNGTTVNRSNESSDGFWIFQFESFNLKRINVTLEKPCKYSPELNPENSLFPLETCQTLRLVRFSISRLLHSRVNCCAHRERQERCSRHIRKERERDFHFTALDQPFLGHRARSSEQVSDRLVFDFQSMHLTAAVRSRLITLGRDLVNPLWIHYAIHCEWLFQAYPKWFCSDLFGVERFPLEIFQSCRWTSNFIFRKHFNAALWLALKKVIAIESSR